LKKLIVFLSALVILVFLIPGCTYPETSPAETPAKNQTNETSLPQELFLDSDGDGMNDWFEANIAHYDPNVPNDRYFILFFRMMEYSEGTRENRDVHLPAQFLIEEGKVPPENIIKMTQGEATASALKSAIEQVAKKSDKNDLVFLSINTHGYNVNSFSASENNPHGIPVESYQMIGQWLGQIEAKAVIVSMSFCGDGEAVPILREGPCPRVIYLHAGGWFLHMLGLNPGYSKKIATYYGNDPYVSVGEVADCLDDQLVYLSDWNITRERKNAKRIVTYKKEGNYHKVDESKAKLLATDPSGYVRVEIESSLYPWSAMVDPSNIAYEIYLTDYKIPS